MALSDEHSITHPSSQIRIGNSFDLQEKGTVPLISKSSFEGVNSFNVQAMEHS
jgi:hypothetical protein